MKTEVEGYVGNLFEVVEVPPSHPDLTWVKIRVHVQKVATGEVVTEDTYTTYFPEDGESPNPYMWSDGNESCDCNRALTFARARGEDDPDIPCSDGLYRVNLENPYTGTIYYREFIP